MGPCKSENRRVTFDCARGPFAPRTERKSRPTLVRAPRWTGNLGFNYETPITSGLKLGLSGNVSHSDKYFTDTTNTPGGLMKSFQLVDATVRVMTEDERWEFALIGRNLTDEYYFVRSSDGPFTGSVGGCAPAPNPPVAACSAANIANPLRSDTAASVNRGREIMVRVAFKY